MIKPPRLADRWLQHRLAHDERDELVGDLHEQFARRVTADGVAAARRWYWRQSMALIWGFSMQRRDVVSVTHERVRGRWFADNIATDTRYAWRSLKHSRSFAWIAFLTLMSGIGLSTALFSLVSGILVHPLPYAHSDRLVRIGEFVAGKPIPDSGGSLSDTAIGQWLTKSKTVEALSPYGDTGMTVMLPTGAANLAIGQIGAQFFQVLGITPDVGRLLTPQDAATDAPHAVMISHRLWTNQFGQRADVTSQSIVVDGVSYSIAGVLPRAFAWPNADIDVWLFSSDYNHRWPEPGARRNFMMHSEVIALLKPGATIEAANAEGRSIALGIATADPNFADGQVEPSRMRVRRLLDDIALPVRPALLTLSAGMLLVLFAGCVNLANLLLARHTARQRELSVRLALGASRWRVIRPVLIELLLLGSGGGLAGAMLAWWLIRALPLVAPADLPRLESLHFDVRTLAFAVFVSVATALLVGLLPVLQMPATDVREVTSAGGRMHVAGKTRSADRLRSSLVVAQISVAVVLLVGSLLVSRSLWALIHVNPGYKPDRVLTFQASMPLMVFREAERQRTFYHSLLDRLKANPEIQSAAYAMTLPMHQVSRRSSVNIAGRPIVPVSDPSQMAISTAVSSSYFATMGTHVVRGRGFTDADTMDAEKVLLIDEEVQRRYFPNEDPIGMNLLGPRAAPWKIVGVVEAVRMGRLGDPPVPVIYYHADQMAEIMAYSQFSGIAIRTTGKPATVMPFVREVARSLDPTVPIYNARTLDDQISDSVAQPRFFALVLGLFSAMALSTALLGIYGALAYSVERRRIEFGVRRALGATERHVLTLVGAQSLRLTIAGLVIGLGAAMLLTKWMRSVLFDVAPADPISFAGAALLIVAVVIAASWPPVRRALRVDPARALRVD